MAEFCMLNNDLVRLGKVVSAATAHRYVAYLETNLV